ncbi:MAG TPA: hypothetical protein VFH92_08580 [Phenylobacterium sp.]|nr:hypothetical protein [Phenylobacterium sp.]
MQNFRWLCAIAAGAVLAAGGAVAQTDSFRGEAKLVAPAPAAVSQTIAGADWRCDGDACVGVAAHKANLDSLVRECKKVTAVLGPVASYRSNGREADAGQLRACNADAVKVQTARN